VNQANSIKATIGAALLNIRVPTTTPPVSEERIKQIEQSIQPGDIILETDNAYPEWQRLEYLAYRSAHTHACMYEGNGVFIEATSPGGVMRTELREYLEGRKIITVLRPAYATPQDRDAALDFHRAQLGKPYNDTFDLYSTSSYTCTALEYQSLQAMPNKMEVPVRKFFGHDEVAPDFFMEMKGVTKVYDDGSSFWKNQFTHWPVALTAIGGGVAAGIAGGGALAGLGGFAAALTGAILVGNKIQTGHFNFSGL